MSLADRGRLPTLRSWQLGLIYLAAWLVPAAGLRLLIDYAINSMLLHIAYVMLILPAATFAVGFIYTKRCGLKPWLICYMTAATAALYLWCGFDSLSPNFCLVNLIGGFFGFGIGNIFKNEPLVAAQENIDNVRKRRKAADEKNYISLIDADPQSGNTVRANKRKNKSGIRDKK